MPNLASGSCFFAKYYLTKTAMWCGNVHHDSGWFCLTYFKTRRQISREDNNFYQFMPEPISARLQQTHVNLLMFLICLKFHQQTLQPTFNIFQSLFCSIHFSPRQASSPISQIVPNTSVNKFSELSYTVSTIRRIIQIPRYFRQHLL